MSTLTDTKHTGARRQAVEAQAQRLRRTIGRDCVETFIALMRRANVLDTEYATLWHRYHQGQGVTSAMLNEADVARTEAKGALERYLDELGVSESVR
jgi:proline dehydrogenase